MRFALHGLMMGISKNSSHDEVTVLFPSYVIKILRIGTTMRADFCLV